MNRAPVPTQGCRYDHLLEFLEACSSLASCNAADTNY